MGDSERVRDVKHHVKKVQKAVEKDTSYIQERNGATRFCRVTGGTHLGLVEMEQGERTIEVLRRFEIGRLGVSHCTGPKVATRLAHEYGERFFFCSVGTVVEA